MLSVIPSREKLWGDAMARKPWEYSFEASERLRTREPAREPVPSRNAGQHPCARGPWCSGSTATVTDGKTVTSPALCYAAYCQKCRNKVYRDLGEIPELWVRLHQELGSKGQAGEKVTIKGASAPLPLRADIDAILREYLDVLASWDERVRTARRLAEPDTQDGHLRPDHGRQVQRMCRTLAAHLDDLLELPADAMSRSFSLHDLGKIPEGCHGHTNRIGGYAEVTVELSGADAGTEILALHYRARSVLGETRMTERLDVPCPDPACDLLMLERRQGSSYEAECRACGRLMTTQEYRSWTQLYAATMSIAELDRAKAARSAVA